MIRERASRAKATRGAMRQRLRRVADLPRPSLPVVLGLFPMLLAGSLNRLVDIALQQRRYLFQRLAHPFGQPDRSVSVYRFCDAVVLLEQEPVGKFLPGGVEQGDVERQDRLTPILARQFLELLDAARQQIAAGFGIAV